MKKLKAPRGVSDLLPEMAAVHRTIESEAAAVLDSYGFQEIRLPLIEQTELFVRSVGASSDIVQKELFAVSSSSGADSDSRNLCLRPEGTAGCMRAVLEDGRAGTEQRLWYCGPMFRYERPQHGRRRQFHQIGAELLGPATPEADVELMAICQQLFTRLGIASELQLEINTLGSESARAAYRDELQSWLGSRREQLDSASRERLEKNPLRILDSKVPQTRALLEQAPSLEQYLDEESREHFAAVCELLRRLNIPFSHNPNLVRGLDYYNHTVFEWIAESGLGAQNAVAAGGRYDGLAELLGGRTLAAAGFALGCERIALLCENRLQSSSRPPDACMIAATSLADSLVCVETIRRELPALSILGPAAGSLKSQFRRAHRSGAKWALIYGEEEARSGSVGLKNMFEANAEQSTVKIVELKNIPGLSCSRQREDINSAQVN